MTGTLILVGVLIATILRANKERGKIESKKVNYAHIALMVFAVLITSLSLNVLFKLVLQFDATMQMMYVERGLFTPPINAAVWILNTILSVVVLFAVMSVAQRSEKARKVLVGTLPLLFAVSSVKSVNEIIALSTPETAIGLPIGFVIAGMFLSFAPLFFFYTNQNIKNIIFAPAMRKENSDEPDETTKNPRSDF